MWRAHCLLVASLLLSASSSFAFTTVDVGADSVGNVWRPQSCDILSEGVSLINVTAHTRAVIEGCTITRDAADNELASAVSIAGLGANASVELRNCNITAVFRTTSTSSLNRHGAVRLESEALLGNDSRLLIANSTVSMEEDSSAAGEYGSAVLFDIGITAGDGFEFRVSNGSTLRATCPARCGGFLAVGHLWSNPSSKSVFGERTSIAVIDSVVVSTTHETHARAFHFSTSITFGRQSVVSVLRSTITASARTSTSRAFQMFGAIAFGANSSVSIIDSTITSLAQIGSFARAVGFLNTISFGAWSAVSILRSNITASSHIQSAHSATFRSVTFGPGSVVEIVASNVVATVQGSSGNASSCITFEANVHFEPNGTIAFDRSHLVSSAGYASSVVLLMPSLSFISITVDSSTLQFNGSALSTAGGSDERSGAIVSANGAVWTSVTLAVTSTSFVTGDMTNSGGGWSNAFVQWPMIITGASPQTFDNVTFSTGPVRPFAMEANESRPNSEATLCLRDVRWSNGKAIVRGPPSSAFVVPSEQNCSVPTATTSATSSQLSLSLTSSVSGVSLSTSRSPSVSETLAASMSLSEVTVSAPTTSATLAGSVSVSRTSTRTGSVSQTETLLPPRPPALPRTIPLAVAVVAMTGAVVGAGVAGATQAGRTVAVLQLVACSSGEGVDEQSLQNQHDQKTNEDTEDDGSAATFPEALIPWLKLGGGQAGWDRGVVIGNVVAIFLAFLLGFGIWAGVVFVVHHVSQSHPKSFVARAAADQDAPAEANSAAVRMCRLLRFPGVAVTIPVGFAVDGFVGESVALIRHGIESRYDATVFDIVLGAVAVVIACCLWTALLYVALVVVPRNVTFCPAHARPHEPTDMRPSKTKRLLSANVYGYLRALRDGGNMWSASTPAAPPSLRPDSLVIDDRHSADEDDESFFHFSLPGSNAGAEERSHSALEQAYSSDVVFDSFHSLDVTSAPKELSHAPNESTTKLNDSQSSVDEANSELVALNRHIFVARWAVLFAPLRHGALFYPALDAAASVAIAIARGLRPRTADGCQRALLGVAIVQVALLVAVLIIRPFVAPLKTAVVAAASAFLAISAVVGAAAGLAPASHDKEPYGVAAGYLATCASIALLANPVMAMWRVAEGRVIARAVTRPLSSTTEENTAEDPLLFNFDCAGPPPGDYPPNEGNALTFEMMDYITDATPASSENVPSAAGLDDSVSALMTVDCQAVDEVNHEASTADPLAFDHEDTPALADQGDETDAAHRRVYRDGEVVLEKGGHGAVLAAELEAMLAGFT